MSLTIEIAPELEGQIRQAAAEEGLTPDTFVLKSIAECFAFDVEDNS